MDAPERSRSRGRSSRLTSASLGSSRASMAPSFKPGRSPVGRSLRECTAISISFRSKASSISLVKTPLPPIRARAAFGWRSPNVLMMTSRCSLGSPGRDARTCSLCASASALPRVPILIRFLLAADSEKLAHGVDPPEPLAAVLAGSVQPSGGAMEQLLHDRAGQRLERGVILGAEAPAMALQLLLRDPLEVAPERGDRRLQLERAVPAHEPAYFVVDDRLHLGDLGAALFQALGDDH